MFPILLSFLFVPFLANNNTAIIKNNVQTLATHEFSLEDRYQNTSVNTVFKDNILLAINYTTDSTIDVRQIDWKQIENPFHKTMTLEPGQTFAFHDDVLPQYNGKITTTTHAHFNSQEGFKSDGYLVGDGVCHLASLLYWVARDAGLDTLAPTRHDFAPVPDVPAEFGVSIYDSNQSKSSSNELQNLYITNNKDKSVVFDFDSDGRNLTITAEEKI